VVYDPIFADVFNSACMR